MKRDVSDLIQTLINDQEAKCASGLHRDVQSELTSMGAILTASGERIFSIDVSNIHVFRNLHTFTQLLSNEVIEQCAFGTADIMVRRKVDPNLTPELAAAGLDWVMVYARMDAAESFPFFHRHFGNCMQVVFRTLQTEKWGGIILADYFGAPYRESSDTETTPALLFPFHLRDKNGEGGHYFLVEYSKSGRFLRITIENANNSRLQLKHIPHRVVDQAVRGSFLPDIHLIAEQIHQGILHECFNKRSEYKVLPSHQHYLFNHLHNEGLLNLQMISFSWPTDYIQMLMIEENKTSGVMNESLAMLVAEIQLLEDPRVIACLAGGNVVEMKSGLFKVFFDISRYGACLNVCFDERRHVLQHSDYLADMPSLAAVSGQRAGSMQGVRLFLIHHITAEVVGLLRAFSIAGFERMTTFFVKYAGIVPDAYMETLMSLPPDIFRFFALQKVESREKISGCYKFSRQFTPAMEFEKIDEAIFDDKLDFFGAMRLAAGHLFIKEIILAKAESKKVLLVEDGGYLTPLMNRFCLENRKTWDVLNYFKIEAADQNDSLFSVWLEEVFIGSVEHTRNGYNCDLEVANEFGKLQFPVATIALSNLKRGPEARECAVAILNAAESILGRLGMILYRRTVLLLGSSGAIGGFLKKELLNRIEPGHLYGVDIARSGSVFPSMIIEEETVDALGNTALAEIDMFIGVIGASILKEKQIEEIILNSHRKNLFFISGSTKTVEFTDLENFLQNLGDNPRANLAGMKIQVGFSALRDLQTGILQGYQVNVSFPDEPSRDKKLYLLGELMPINFLYYGIPREMVDEVMAQLFTVSCGLVRRQQSEKRLEPRLLAVDHHIDVDANPL